MNISRRQALSTVAAAPSAIAAKLPSTMPSMPTVPFGPHRISRLLVGGNPVSGNSHWDSAMDREMVDYFTSGNIKLMLRNCERSGINTWQSRADKHIIRMLHEYRQEGGTMQWVAQTASEVENTARNIRDMMAEKPIGIYHHGSRTDQLWDAGKIDEVKNALKLMRDAGVRVGLGTHIPQVIDYAEDKGWDVDFYMTCLYNLSRPREEADRLAGGKAPRELILGSRPHRDAQARPADLEAVPDLQSLRSDAQLPVPRPHARRHETRLPLRQAARRGRRRHVPETQGAGDGKLRTLRRGHPRHHVTPRTGTPGANQNPSAISL